MIDREVSKGIVVNPGRCGGEPAIKGTRITASMVVAIGATHDGIETLIDQYDLLTTLDIANARGWDRKGRPYEAPRSLADADEVAA